MNKNSLAVVLCGAVAVLPVAGTWAQHQDDLSARTATVLARPTENPKLGHAITLRFADLPGPIAALSGTADFEVANSECVAIDYELAPGGVRIVPRHRQTLTWTRGEDGSYRAVVYEDAFVDENYFKIGLCRWRLQFITVRFRSPATEFVGVASLDDVRTGSNVVQHYLAHDWTAKPAAMDRVFGEKAGHYLSTAGPQFTLTIAARKL